MQGKLFADRVPEAAARQLATVLADAAECQLATVELLKGRSRVSKIDMKRHETIAATLVAHCVDLRVEPYGLRGRHCSRLAQAMDEVREREGRE